jgi:hypothetical protein
MVGFNPTKANCSLWPEKLDSLDPKNPLLIQAGIFLIQRSWNHFLKKGRRICLDPGEKEELFEHLENMLKTLKFGSITLVVQDGRIVQIEKNEKVRLQSNKNR